MNPRTFRRRHAVIGGLCAGASLLAGPLAAQPNFPITPQQRSTAQQVAQAGVPLSELVPNAPDSHTVQSGDTLWDISKLFLKSPWRWPELWGMNLEQIRNPHLIYPGQVLVLEKSGDRARLRVAQAGSGAPENTVRLSPRVRSNLLDNGAIGVVHATRFASGHFNDLTLRIFGTQGGLEVKWENNVSSLRGSLGDDMMTATWKDLPCPEVKTNYVRFVEAIRAGQQVKPDFARGAELQKVLDLAVASDKAHSVDLTV